MNVNGMPVVLIYPHNCVLSFFFLKKKTFNSVLGLQDS